MKLFDKKGREVSLGDTLVIKKHIKDDDFGECEQTFECLITEYTLPILLKRGFLRKEEENKQITLVDCIEYLSRKNNWDFPKTLGFINKVYDICSGAALKMILKAAAILLDRRYEGHINTTKELWIVSFAHNKVMKADPAEVVDYNNFAAFRTKQDAELAHSIIKEFLNGRK